MLPVPRVLYWNRRSLELPKKNNLKTTAMTQTAAQDIIPILYEINDSKRPGHDIKVLTYSMGAPVK